jgi:predicted PurR-regulated permease PerM
VGLPGLWVLAAVTIGGGAFGILGMLLGVPVCSVVYSLVQAYIRTKPEAEENQ